MPARAVKKKIVIHSFLSLAQALQFKSDYESEVEQSKEMLTKGYEANLTSNNAPEMTANNKSQELSSLAANFMRCSKGEIICP